ncbi:PH domain-containing protein [Rhodopirellula baltica]|uniref:Bacterial membrane flanked domain family n=1 Tax=Rhodopirellula baltica WH47 TaxID=991778 RepID=F2AUC9_RHOBT|nr:PH domain-containing protein [Rhodopirellula baltica]EGF26696.1 Bacterial membrane flanked domain family [Rhodopirellula baltica WH47]
MRSEPKPLHPISIVFQAVAVLKRTILPLALVAWNGAQSSWLGFLGAYGFLAVMVAGFGMIGFIRYWFYRYQLTQGELIVTSGVFFKSRRNVPVVRIQNVDLVQNVFHRILGVAEVRVETASGTEPEAILKVLSLSEVDSLRGQIEAARQQAPALGEVKTSNANAGETTHAVPVSANAPVDLTPVSASTTLLEIPLKWLVQAGLASNRGFVMVGIVIGILSQQMGNDNQFVLRIVRNIPSSREMEIARSQANWWESWLVWVGALFLVLVLIRLLGIAWYVLRFYGYRLELRDENLQLSCGLLTRVSATVPRRRIQWISIHRSPLQRWMKLASIRIETAGGAGKQNEDAATTVTRRWFVPIIPESSLDELVEQLRPGLKWSECSLEWQSLDQRALKRMRRKSSLRAQGISILAGGLAFLLFDFPYAWTLGVLVAVVLIPLNIWVAQRRHRHFGFAELPSGDGVVIREGFWDRKVSCTFYDRIQSVSCSETPFDRRWNMQTLRIDTAAAGPADHVYRLPMLSRSTASELFDRLSSKTSGIEMVWD